MPFDTLGDTSQQDQEGDTCDAHRAALTWRWTTPSPCRRSACEGSEPDPTPEPLRAQSAAAAPPAPRATRVVRARAQQGGGRVQARARCLGVLVKDKLDVARGPRALLRRDLGWRARGPVHDHPLEQYGRRLREERGVSD